MSSRLQHSDDPPADAAPAADWAPADRLRQKDRPRVAERARRLRAAMGQTEARLWRALRHLNADGARFRRQCAVDQYVFDFGDYSARLLIEVDGVVHDLIDDVALNDARKSAVAASAGFTLLRFRNDDVWRRLDRVMREIRAHQPSPLRGGSDAQRPGRGARRATLSVDEASSAPPPPEHVRHAPHPDALTRVDPPRKGEGLRRASFETLGAPKKRLPRKKPL